jgi:hypothetical protein
MLNGDLYHAMKEGDKVFFLMKAIVDEEELARLNGRFNCKVKFRASPFWVGQPPRIDGGGNANFEFPLNAGKMILSFLEKRNLDEDSFTRLIKGELPPKKYQKPIAADVEVLDDEISIGRIVEIIKPVETAGGGGSNEAKGATVCTGGGAAKGTSNGILLIESGPYAGDKAFINRSCITVFGHKMTKADMMYFINPTDKFRVELRGIDTKNRLVPHTVLQVRFNLTYRLVRFKSNKTIIFSIITHSSMTGMDRAGPGGARQGGLC